jgi:hypothetical protein
MILMWANTFRAPLEGVGGGGPENRDFFDNEMATIEATAIWAQKTEWRTAFVYCFIRR